MLAELVDVVIGVDTHTDTHTAAVVTAATGALVATVTVPADADGYTELVELADRHGGCGLGRSKAPEVTASDWLVTWANTRSWWSNSTGPAVPPVAVARSPTHSMRRALPAKPSPAPGRPSPRPARSERRCRCC
jgi:transposase